MGRVFSECERARIWASLAADGELSELERSSLGAHEARCPDCARYHRALTIATRLLRESAPEQPRVALFEPARRRSVYGRLQLAAAAAAVVAALAAGSLAGALSSGGDTPAVRSEASTHRLLIQQSLLALATADDRGSGPRAGRMIVI